MNFTFDELKLARERGYSDDEIWNTLASEDKEISLAKDRGYSLEEVTSIVSGKPMPEPEPREFFSFEDAVSAIGTIPEALAVGVPAAYQKLVTGLEIPEKSEAIESELAFQQRIQTEQADRVASGKATTFGSAIREALPSLGFSVLPMAAAIPAGIGGGMAGGPAAPVTGPAAAMAASGTVAYRMAGSDMMYRAYKQLEEAKGSPLTNEEKAEYYKTVLPIAQNYGLWEAGPEAVSNAITMGVGKFVFGFGKQAAKKLVGESIDSANKTIARKVAEKGAAVAGGLGAEIASEGVTAVGQYPEEAKIRQLAATGEVSKGEQPSYPGGYMQAVKDVAPATIALYGMMGTAAGGVKLSTLPFRSQKTPEQIAEDNINLEADRVSRELSIGETDEETKSINAALETARNNLIAKKEVYTALEPNDPAAQSLGLEIREMEREVVALDNELKKRVGEPLSEPITTIEEQQAALAKAITAKPKTEEELRSRFDELKLKAKGTKQSEQTLPDGTKVVIPAVEGQLLSSQEGGEYQQLKQKFEPTPAASTTPVPVTQAKEEEAAKSETEKKDADLKNAATAFIYELTSPEIGEALDLDVIELALDNIDRQQAKGKEIDWARDRIWLPNISTSVVKEAKTLLSAPEGRQAMRERIAAKKQEALTEPTVKQSLTVQPTPPAPAKPIVTEEPPVSMVGKEVIPGVTPIPVVRPKAPVEQVVTPPVELDTQTRNGIQSGVASADPDMRELWAIQLKAKLDKKGSLTWKDIPQELSDSMDTIEFGALKKALAINPQAAINLIEGNVTPPVEVAPTIAEAAPVEPITPAPTAEPIIGEKPQISPIVGEQVTKTASVEQVAPIEPTQIPLQKYISERRKLAALEYNATDKELDEYGFSNKELNDEYQNVFIKSVEAGATPNSEALDSLPVEKVIYLQKFHRNQLPEGYQHPDQIAGMKSAGIRLTPKKGIVKPAPVTEQAAPAEAPATKQAIASATNIANQIEEENKVLEQQKKFSPPTAPTLQDARSLPDAIAKKGKTLSISGGKQEKNILDPKESKKRFDEIGYERQALELPEDMNGRVSGRYGNAISNIKLNYFSDWLGAHFHGGVAISNDVKGTQRGRVIAHELGHASHSLLGDKINKDQNVLNELQAIEELLYPGLRDKVSAASNPDASFFNYLLSPNELIAEFNVERVSNPERATQVAPALSALLESAEKMKGLVADRKTFPVFGGAIVENKERLKVKDFEVRKNKDKKSDSLTQNQSKQSQFIIRMAKKGELEVAKRSLRNLKEIQKSNKEFAKRTAELTGNQELIDYVEELYPSATPAVSETITEPVVEVAPAISDSTKRREAIAIESVNTPQKLTRRLQDALDTYGIKNRKSWTLDFENKQLVSPDKTTAIKWTTRYFPNEPESYRNQQTNLGKATLVKYQPTPAVSETITEPVQRDATKPEQMTPEEFAQFEEDYNKQARVQSAKKAKAQVPSESGLEKIAEDNDILRIEGQSEWYSFQVSGKRIKKYGVTENGARGTGFYSAPKGGSNLSLSQLKQWLLDRVSQNAQMGTYTPFDPETAQGDAIYQAFEARRPISSEAYESLESYQKPDLPEGYVKQGELYVYQPTAKKPKLGEKGGVLIPTKEDVRYNPLGYDIADVVEDINQGKTSTPLKAVNQVIKESTDLRKRVAAESTRRQQPRKMGKAAILERIARERSAGNINENTAKALTDFINRVNEDAIWDTAISIRAKGVSNYDFADNLVTFFLNQDKGDFGASVGIHEFWHGLSRFLPDAEVEKINNDYTKELADYLKKNPWFLAFVGRYSLTPEQFEAYKFFNPKEAETKLTPVKDEQGNIVKYNIKFDKDNYRYIMLDEFIAEKMTDLVLGKQQEPNTFLGKLAKILREFMALIKSRLGIAPYEKFYQAVTSTNGKLVLQRETGVAPAMQIYDPVEYDYSTRKMELKTQDARFAELEARAKAGDKEAEAEAQRMVDEAAKEAGYDIGPVFHGTTKQFNQFKEISDFNRLNGFYFGTKKDAEFFAKGIPKGRIIPAYLSIKNPASMSDMQEAEKTVSFYSTNRGNQIKENLIKQGFDGAILYFEDSKETEYVAFNPEQIKSADPFTYDDAGNLIPLSERFQPTSPDIRMMAVEAEPDKEQIKGEKIGPPKKTPEGIIAKTQELLRKQFDPAKVTEQNTTEAFRALGRLMGKGGTDFAKELNDIGRVVDESGAASEISMGAALFVNDLFEYSIRLAAEGDSKMLGIMMANINRLPTAMIGASDAGRTLAARAELKARFIMMGRAEQDAYTNYVAEFIYGPNPTKEQIKSIKDAYAAVEKTPQVTEQELTDEIKAVGDRAGTDLVGKINEEFTKATEKKTQQRKTEEAELDTEYKKIQNQADAEIEKLAKIQSDTPSFDPAAARQTANDVRAIVANDLKQRPDMGRKAPWKSMLVAKLQQVGVELTAAETLADIVWRQHEINSLSRELSSINKAIEKGPISEIVKAIKETPLEEQQNPNWRYEVMRDYLRKAGLNVAQSERIAKLMDISLQKRFTMAQEQAFTDAISKSAPWKTGDTRSRRAFQKVLQALRAGALDPARNVLSDMAALNGWTGFTPEQYKTLLKYDAILADPESADATKAQAHKVIQDIISKAKLPIRARDVIGQFYDAQALSGIPTVTVNIFSPAGVAVKNALTQALNGVITARPEQITAALTTFADSIKSWANTVAFSFKNNVTVYSNVEYLVNDEGLLKLYKKGVDQFNNGKTPRDRADGVKNMMVGMMDYVRRVLNALDYGAIAALQNQSVSKYALAAMQAKGMSSKDGAKMLNAMMEEKRNFYNDQIAIGTDKNKAAVLADEFFISAWRQALTDAKLPAQQVMDAALNDAMSAVGRNRQSLDAFREEETDIRDNGVTSFPAIWLLETMANAANKQDSQFIKIFSRIIYGFAIVPARVLRETAWFSPYGAVRFAYDAIAKKMGKTSPYAQSLGNDLQYRQRLTETIAGSLVMLAFGAAMSASTDDEDDEKPFKIVVTGNGPLRSEDPQYYDSWVKNNRPNTVRVQFGKTKFTLNTMRGFEAFAWPAMMLGAVDDWHIRRKQKRETNTPMQMQDAAIVAGNVLSASLRRGPYAFAAKPLFEAYGDRGVESLAKSLAFPAKTIVPVLGSSLASNISNFLNEPIDRRTLEGALWANVPFIGPAVAPKSLNAFGEPAMANDAADKIFKLGVPIVFDIPTDRDSVNLHELVLKQGGGPSIPTRNQLAQRLDRQPTNKEYEMFAKEYGAVLTKSMKKNYEKLSAMKPEAYTKVVERIGNRARDIAENKVRVAAKKP